MARKNDNERTRKSKNVCDALFKQFNVASRPSLDAALTVIRKELRVHCYNIYVNRYCLLP